MKELVFKRDLFDFIIATKPFVEYLMGRRVLGVGKYSATLIVGQFAEKVVELNMHILHRLCAVLELTHRVAVISVRTKIATRFEFQLRIRPLVIGGRI